MKQRKTSPRTKQIRTISAASAALKAKWADPVWRAELLAKRKKVPKGHKHRLGVPDGIRKRDALPLWERAKAQAKRFIEIMEDNGELEKVVIPGSEAEMAKRALEEAFALALSPLSAKEKAPALRLVLDFTKAKPESKSKLTLENSDEWLSILAADMKSKDGNSGTE